MGSTAEAGRTASYRVCEVCHSQTAHHRNRVTGTGSTNTNGGTPVTGTDEPTGGANANHYYGAAEANQCTGCHSHDKAFAASCGACHGNPPTSPATMAFNPSVTWALGNTSTNVGAHQAHAVDMAMKCDTCHTGTTMPTVSNTIQMGIVVNSTNWPGHFGPYQNTFGSISARSGANLNGYTYVGTGATVVNQVNGYSKYISCNVYCHANWPGNGGTMSNSRWTQPSDGTCGACHFVNAAGVPAAGAPGSHSKHASSATYGFKCSVCHNGNPDTKNHVQGYAQVFFDTASSAMINVGAKYNGIVATTLGTTVPSTGNAGIATNYKACDNLYCHSNGKSDGFYPTGAGAPTWGTSNGSVICTSCHGNGVGTYPAGTNDLSAPHNKHVNNTGFIGDNYTCYDCHARTVNSSSTAIIDNTKHVNSFVDISGVRAGKYNQFNYSLNSTIVSGLGCNVTYCHSSGKKGQGTVAEPTAPNWTASTPLDCKGCHGNSNSANTSNYGEPSYNSQGVAQPGANSHSKHVTVTSGATVCQYCHRLTTTTGTSIITGSLHTNGQINPRLKRVNGFTTFSGAYVVGTKTCSATYCHGSATPQWGGPSFNCDGCHSANPQTAAGTNRYWNAYSSAHIRHLEVNVLPSSYATYSGNVSSSGSYRFSCSACHRAVHANGSATNNRAADVLFNFTTAGKSGSYSEGAARTTKDSGFSWTGGTCTNIYCHSDGAGGGPKKAFNWASPKNTLRCYGCHGAQDIKNGTTQAAANYSSIRTNAHARHVRPDINTELGYGNGLAPAY